MVLGCWSFMLSFSHSKATAMSSAPQRISASNAIAVAEELERIAGSLWSPAESKVLAFVFSILDAYSTYGQGSLEPLSRKFEVHLCSFCCHVIERGVGGVNGGKQDQKVNPRLPFCMRKGCKATDEMF
jgi:hypothetical protein